MRASLRLAAVAALVGLPLEASGQALRSVYTSLDTARCRLLSRDEEAGGTLHRCRGVAGYALQVAYDDDRMSVNVVTPAGRVHELNYWGVITGNFSSLGPRAEWRMRGERPIALIVRVNASEDPSNPGRTTSYLAVARVSARGSCVTDRIAPSANANELARRAADQAAGRPCLQRGSTK
ncbi:MAG TPA: hypothetical protein VF647_20545 [Longimicrobium sp.]|jgi:hypothetical protein